MPHIGVARLEIEEALLAPIEQQTAATGAPKPPPRSLLPWAVAIGALAAAGALLMMWAPWRKADVPWPLRLTTEIGADATLADAAVLSGLALSPEGKLLAFAAQKTSGGEPQLYVRRLDQLQAAALPGTDGARDPFFSPDGQWIAFFAAGKLKKISANGGAAVSLCDAPAGRGGTWAEDGTIAFAPAGGPNVSLVRVSAAGGTPEPLTRLEGVQTHRYPQTLKGGKAILFTAGNLGNFDEASIIVQQQPDGAQRVVQRGGYYGRYLTSGHLIYVQGGTLFAAPFDLDRLELTGQAVPVVEGVRSGVGAGIAQFAVSANGTLVFQPGQSVGSELPIAWMDRDGKTTPMRSSAEAWSNPHFSPDGTRLAVDIARGNIDVWVYDWARDTLTALTVDADSDLKPVWTPDGRRVVFASTRGDKSTANLYWQRADGTGEAQRLTESKNSQLSGSWHPNGRLLAFVDSTPQSGSDIMVLPMEGDEEMGWKPGTPTVFLGGPLNARGANVLAGRQVGGVPIQRVGTERGLRAAISWSRRQGSSLDG